MPILHDAQNVPARTGTIYPEPFKDGFDGRIKRALTGRLGLSQFGVNITTLEAGARSALRHWHEIEDECIFILSGEVTLRTNDGETLLKAGDAAGFPAGEKNAHCLINKSRAPATYLEIGTRAKDETAHYPDVDLELRRRNGTNRFFHKDGTPYE